MIIYVRSSEGDSAASSKQSALPSKLKMILKAIDGVTATSLLEKNLNSYGDVRSILRSLEMAGLVKSTVVDVKSVRFNMKFKDSNPNDLVPVKNSNAWAETRSPLEKAFEVETTFDTSDSLQEKLDAENLASIVNEMSIFVLTHLPEQSFQTLKEIEEISSLEILAATLGGYEQIISHLGERSAQHLRRINSTLRAKL